MRRRARRRARASAEGRSPPAAVDGWQLTVTKRAGTRAPLVEPAQKLLAVDTLIRFPLLLLSAPNHLIFGFGSLLETGAQCKRAKLIIKGKKKRSICSRAGKATTKKKSAGTENRSFHKLGFLRALCHFLFPGFRKSSIFACSFK